MGLGMRRIYPAEALRRREEFFDRMIGLLRSP